MLDLPQTGTEAGFLPFLQQAPLAVADPFIADAGPLLECLAEGRRFLADAHLQPLEVLILWVSTLLLHRALHALELHSELRTLDPHVRNALQVARKTYPRQGGDQPLARVVLPPADAVAVIVLKDVVEVVIALAVGEKGQRAIVARRVLVRVRLRAPHVRQGIDEEGEVVVDHEAQHSRQQEDADRVAYCKPYA